jgi:glycosyltransferase involved in cell wall biosynthesis
VAGEDVRISVVIPARNEERNIAAVLQGLPPSYEVLIVDGQSTDATLLAARDARPGALLLSQRGSGKGDAVALGLSHATGDIVVMADADGSMDLSEIPCFVAALTGGADLVKGSRFLPGGGSEDITRIRAAGNACLTRLVNLLFRTQYTDLCYGYMAFWRESLAFAIDAEGFDVEALINIRAARARLKVVEIPSFEGPRLHGTSNLRIWRDGFRILRTILRERLTGAVQPTDSPNSELVLDLQEAVSEASQATTVGS